MKLSVPEYVTAIIMRFEECGFLAYAVGGCVRDSVLGFVPNDWDITCSASPDEMISIFETENFKTYPTGIKHGTVSVSYKGNICECTTFRIDGEYLDSRHPESVTFSKDVGDDLKRRDFTVNAMAYDPCEHKVIDLYCGMEDIKNKIIRAVGDPRKRFSEDALRILRAVRFSVQLGFEIEKDTLSAMKELSDNLKNIASERIASELFKILSHKNFLSGIEIMNKTGISGYVFPSVDTDTLCTCLRFDILSTAHERLSLLFSKADREDVSRFCVSLKLSRRDREKLLFLHSLKDITAELFSCTQISHEAMARRFIFKTAPYTAESVSVCRALGVFPNGFTDIVEKENNARLPRSLKDLKINGNDLLTNNICKASDIGRILSKLLSLTVDDPTLNEKDTLLDLSRRMINCK